MDIDDTQPLVEGDQPVPRLAQLAQVPLDAPVPAPLPAGPEIDPTGTNVGGQAAKWNAIALQAATGRSINDLAGMFGYSYGGMQQLLRSPHMVERVRDHQSAIMDRAAAGAAKILLHLDRMLDVDIGIALPMMETGELDPALAASKKSIDVRHYLMDKVLAAKQVVTNINKNEQSPEVQNLVAESRELLARLTAAMTQRTVDIEASPHIYDGDRAVIRALDLTDPDAPTGSDG